MQKILFQMDSYKRKHIIGGHEFYIEQARSRLLSQFHNIEDEANKYAEDWLDSVSHHFDPERHDGSEFYEQANEESIWFYEMLDEMRTRTQLSVIAGLFHEWDKQLRNWLVEEIHHWHIEEYVKRAIWKANFKQIIDLLETFDWHISSENYYASIDRCRLVVNAYKHGDGGAFESIKKEHPEFVNTFGSTDTFGLMYAGYGDLKVEDAHLTEFSDAIVEFWNNVPENVFEEKFPNFPEWFHNAYLKGIKEKNPK